MNRRTFFALSLAPLVGLLVPIKPHTVLTQDIVMEGFERQLNKIFISKRMDMDTWDDPDIERWPEEGEISKEAYRLGCRKSISLKDHLTELRKA